MILFLNYTGESYHWGCHATATAIYERLAARDTVTFVRVEDIHRMATPALEEIETYARSDSFAADHPALAKKLAEATTVVVNGEGTLHGRHSPGARGLLTLIAAAKAAGLPVNLINHSVFPGDFTDDPAAATHYADILSGLNFIAARDSASAAFYRAHGIACTLSFDCLPLYVRDHTRLAHDNAETAPIVIAGAVDMTEAAFQAMCQQIRDAFPEDRLIYLLGSPGANAAEDLRFAGIAARRGDIEISDAVDFDAFIQTVAQARLLISGRFHYNIAALSTISPLISFNSNTPKNPVMLGDVGYPAEVLAHSPFPTRQFTRLLHKARANRADFRPRTTPEELAALAERNFEFLTAVPANPSLQAETMGQKLNRLFAQGAHSVVLRSYEAARNDQPTVVQALPAYLRIAIAKSYRACKQPAESARLCGDVVAADPANISAHANLIVSLTEAADLPGALTAAKQAVARFPDQTGILIPAAVAALEAGAYPEALVWFRDIVALKPDYYPAHMRLARLYSDHFHNFRAALHHARAASALNPQDATLHRLVGENLILLGEHDEGFTVYQRRLASPAFLNSVDNRNTRLPFWTGEPVEGKLLVMSESVQGIGFELMCAGLLPHLRERGIDCVFEASPRVVPLVAQHYGVDCVALDPETDLSGRTDLTARANLSSLLPILWRDIMGRALPAHDALRSLGPAPRIGLSWQTTNPITGRDRTIPLSDWAPLFDAFPQATWVNLQHGPVGAELAALAEQGGPQVATAGDDFRGKLEGMVATVTDVDLVVSIDNSAVFFADLMNKPVFVIPPQAPHWMWGAMGPRSPFLPNAHIFRRPVGALGRDCIGAVARHLSGIIGKGD